MQFRSGEDSLYAQVLEPEPEPSSLPVVLLHPTPLHHGFWLPVAQRLPGYRRILPDLRAHGRSPLGSALVLTVAQLAADAVALLDALGIGRAVFVGCSIGGYTLYEIWRTAPERVAGLVFCASKPQADTDVERAKREDWIAKMEPARLAGVKSPPPEFVDAMLSALLSTSTRRDHPALVAEVRAMMEQVAPASVQAIQRGLAQRPDARATAQTITVPTCVIAGDEDASSTPADLAALHTLLREGGAPSEYHLLPGAGHYGPVEQPGEVAAILDAFCRSLL